MIELNRMVTRTVVENYHFVLDETAMNKINHYLKTEYSAEPITDNEAAAFMAKSCGYSEYECYEADYLSPKYMTRANEIYTVQGFSGKFYSIPLYEIVGDYINSDLWDSFEEVIDSDTEDWRDELYITKSKEE